MSRVVGQLRDYNGGMIYKLGESLSALKAALGKGADPILIEKFFYALTPIEMRSSLETEPLKHFFHTLQQSVRSDSLHLKQEEGRLFVVFPMNDLLQRKEAIEKLPIASHQLVSFSLDIHDGSYQGYMLLTEDKALQQQFLSSLS